MFGWRATLSKQREFGCLLGCSLRAGASARLCLRGNTNNFEWIMTKSNLLGYVFEQLLLTPKRRRKGGLCCQEGGLGNVRFFSSCSFTLLRVSRESAYRIVCSALDFLQSQNLFPSCSFWPQNQLPVLPPEKLRCFCW